MRSFDHRGTKYTRVCSGGQEAVAKILEGLVPRTVKQASLGKTPPCEAARHSERYPWQGLTYPKLTQDGRASLSMRT